MTELTRGKASVGKLLKPGEYLTLQDKANWLAFKCVSCGKLTNLSKAFHHVEYDGTVTPNVTCPHKKPEGFPCTASGPIVLADWVPEAKGNA